MKKILLTLALAAFAMTANAQFIIGGNIGVNHAGNHDKDFTAGSTATTDISIMPKIGYQLNENMQIGAQLGWDYTYNRVYTDPAGNSKTYNSNPQSAIEIDPYFRYNVASWKNFTVFAEAQLGFRMGLESKTHAFVDGSEVAGSPVKNGDNYTQMGLRVIPGLNYSLSDKFSMDIYIDLLSFVWFTRTDANDNNTHGWGLQCNMEAQDLQAHLNNFSIGFNYHL